MSPVVRKTTGCYPWEQYQETRYAASAGAGAVGSASWWSDALLGLLLLQSVRFCRPVAGELLILCVSLTETAGSALQPVQQM